MTPNFQPRYMLSERELSTLSHQILSHRPPRTTDQLICYMLDGRDIFSNLARHLEREVFFDKFGLNNEDMHRMYNDYEQEPPEGAHECCSAFFLIMDQSDTKRPLPVGAMRIIRYPKYVEPHNTSPTAGPSGPGLPTLHDAARILDISPEAFQSFHNVTDLRKVTDVASFVIPQRYRDLHRKESSYSSSSSSSAYLISNIIMRALLLRTTHDGMSHLVATLDVGIRRLLIDAAGFPFVPFMHGPEAVPCGEAWRRLESASVLHEGSDDSMFMVMQLGERGLLGPELRLRELVKGMNFVVAGTGEEMSGRQVKLAAAVKTSAVLARRIVWGEGIDHLLMFDYGSTSCRMRRRPALIHRVETARL